MSKKKAPPAKRGRKGTVGPEQVSKLREAFMLDFTDELACQYAEIDEQAYYRRRKSDAEFRYQMDKAKNFLRGESRRAVSTAITRDQNPRIAMDWLRHKEPEHYSTAIKVSADKGLVIGMQDDTPLPFIAKKKPKKPTRS